MPSCYEENIEFCIGRREILLKNLIYFLNTLKFIFKITAARNIFYKIKIIGFVFISFRKVQPTN